MSGNKRDLNSVYIEYRMIVNTLSEHISMVILHLGGTNVVFEQKSFYLANLPVLYRINSNGYRDIQ